MKQQLESQVFYHFSMQSLCWHLSSFFVVCCNSVAVLCRSLFILFHTISHFQFSSVADYIFFISSILFLFIFLLVKVFYLLSFRVFTLVLYAMISINLVDCSSSPSFVTLIRQKFCKLNCSCCFTPKS